MRRDPGEEPCTCWGALSQAPLHLALEDKSSFPWSLRWLASGPDSTVLNLLPAASLENHSHGGDN